MKENFYTTTAGISSGLAVWAKNLLVGPVNPPGFGVEITKAFILGAAGGLGAIIIKQLFKSIKSERMKLLSVIKALIGADFFRELIQRLRAESPEWYVKLRWLTGTLTLGLTILKTVVGAGYLPQVAPYLTLSGEIITGLVTAFALSFTAKKDSNA